jgi:hypothetical protein
VEIRLGSSAETAQVSIGADSFTSVDLVETYDVSVTPSGSSTLFKGRHLTLTLIPRPDKYGFEYDATLTAEYGRSTIQERLGCGTRRPQAMPPAQTR